jgi:hypothetical protein
MAEWLILLLLVPAIVVPVVMLVGFAGCQVFFGVDDYRDSGEDVATTGPSEFGDPIIESAFGKSVSIITLKWKDDDPAAAKFEFERTKLPEKATAPPIFATVPSPFEFDDTGLEAETIYQYRVRARDSTDDIISNWSSPEGTGVAATTLSFEPTFDAESQLTLDEVGWEGHCLVQRIEPARLMLSGTQVKLTLRASSVSDASIDRIYISKPAPAGDAWDAATDLKEVATAVVVPANLAITLPPIDYALDKGQPLLIAVDFTPADPNATPPGPFSGIRYADAVPLSEAVAFYQPGSSEAAQSDRSANYTQLNRICLIEKIEVG